MLDVELQLLLGWIASIDPLYVNPGTMLTNIDTTGQNSVPHKNSLNPRSPPRHLVLGKELADGDKGSD